MDRKKSLNFVLYTPLFLLLFLVIFTSNDYTQQGEQILYYNKADTTTEKSIQYRRGIELENGYQSYEEKYFGKNLNEEKRRLFPSQSTGVWIEINPKVPRIDYLGIQFVNKDTGWAVGDLGALIKSTDGGTNWIVSETNTTTPILKVRSFNGQVVIASGFGGLILRSSDGGETFTQMTSNVTGDLWGLQMLNDTLGFACGNTNSLTKTTDGGITWQRIFTPGYNSDYWWIDFMNKNYGFIAANGKVLRTIDGGQNWEIIQAGDSYPLFSIDAIDSLHIAAAGYGGTGYPAKNIYSSDRGNTWVNGGTVTTHEINCIKYVSIDTGYIVMSEIGIYRTTNRGQNWNFIPGIEGVGEYELSLLPENVGYSAGTNLKIYKTENGYDYWKRLIINDNFSDVFFVTEQEGFAISSSGLSAPSGLYKTTDGGVHWEKYPSGINGVDLFFLDSLTGFIGSNQIYKTTDGGVSWYVPNGGQGGAGKIFFINQEIGWAVFSNIIYKTTDRGENWFTQAIVSANFTSIFFLDSLDGWATSNYLWQTTDGGENWIERIDLPSYIFANDIYFNDSTGFVTNLLELEKTTNAGNNWFTQFTSQYIIRTFGWLSTLHGFIMGDGVYETIDSGNTWNEILELRNIGLRKFQSLNNYIGYSTGYLGLMYKYLDTTIVPVELTSFNLEVDKDIVILKWLTATETNNLGFEVLRSSDKQNWNSVTFIEGNGTTTIPHRYKFTNKIETSGIYFYRLKQIDYDGNFKYSTIIEVDINSPSRFSLAQNYPNPFNNSTIISYQIPTDEFVTLVVYDVLGNRIATLVNEDKKSGYYSIIFSSIDLSSGIYFYKLTAGEYSVTRKFLLLK